ncbi:MAG: ADP-ribosylglycohydrolase family protein [Lachnospiraceae bacterium]|nr:ADP-ribosylglycohydrolase family protein [Lachnospiraceae bacterium]
MRTFSKNKIKGALYGIAIGDAMGATTEFMSQLTIKTQYKKRTDIIGKGWLNLLPGEVTDPTEMAFCVCAALEKVSNPKSYAQMQKLLDRCCTNLVAWYDSYPIDMEECCRDVISHCRDLSYKEWILFSQNPHNFNNSNLFGCVPLILCRQNLECVLLQSRLTHNNTVCDNAVRRYRELLLACLKETQLTTQVFPSLPPRFRHIDHTIDSALYHLETTATFETAILEAVYHGGDTNAIAALTGSLAGALYGYENIPERWSAQLQPAVREKLDHYAEILSGSPQNAIAS